jgi:hypothetical protein
MGMPVSRNRHHNRLNAAKPESDIQITHNRRESRFTYKRFEALTGQGSVITIGEKAISHLNVGYRRNTNADFADFTDCADYPTEYRFFLRKLRCIEKTAYKRKYSL